MRAARLDGRRKAYPKNKAEVGGTVLKRPAAKQLPEKEAGVGNVELEPLAAMPTAPKRSASRVDPSETEPLSTMAAAARASSGFMGRRIPAAHRRRLGHGCVVLLMLVATATAERRQPGMLRTDGAAWPR